MKACPKCMQENDDSAKFCILCRSPFGASEAPTCARGHIMDPTWTECAYCKAENAAGPVKTSAEAPGRSKTVVEEVGEVSRPLGKPQQASGGPGSTASSSTSSARRKTVFI